MQRKNKDGLKGCIFGVLEKKLMPNLNDDHRNRKSANNAEMKREQFEIMVYFDDDTTREMAKWMRMNISKTMHVGQLIKKLKELKRHLRYKNLDVYIYGDKVNYWWYDSLCRCCFISMVNGKKYKIDCLD